MHEAKRFVRASPSLMLWPSMNSTQTGVYIVSIVLFDKSMREANMCFKSSKDTEDTVNYIKYLGHFSTICKKFGLDCTSKTGYFVQGMFCPRDVLSKKCLANKPLVRGTKPNQTSTKPVVEHPGIYIDQDINKKLFNLFCPPVFWQKYIILWRQEIRKHFVRKSASFNIVYSI
jgi:hypothetical protein